MGYIFDCNSRVIPFSPYLFTYSSLTHNFTHFTFSEGATSVAMQRLQKAVDTKIPDDLLLLLTEINGGLWFDDKQSYGSEEIIEVIAKNDRNTKLGWQVNKPLFFI